MEINFDQIPSVMNIAPKEEKKLTVSEELDTARRLLNERTMKCELIKPIYPQQRFKPCTLAHNIVCSCPRYRPHYFCKHTGNIIIDRDLLTKEEHICHLATPKSNFGAKRVSPRFYQKRIVLSDCTYRIEELAQPQIQRVKATIDNFKNILKKRQFRSLQKHLKKNPNMHLTKLSSALRYIEEEKRLRRIKKRKEKHRCKELRKKIITKERRQIKKIFCTLFEELKELLLNDQFMFDEKSTIYAVLLENIRAFTGKDFVTSTNLRQYQQVLANNIAVWINKFIQNLNIVVEPQKKPAERPETAAFLPVSDYLELSALEEGMGPMEDIPYPQEEYGHEYEHAFRGEFSDYKTDN